MSTQCTLACQHSRLKCVGSIHPDPLGDSVLSPPVRCEPPVMYAPQKGPSQPQTRPITNRVSGVVLGLYRHVLLAHPSTCAVVCNGVWHATATVPMLCPASSPLIPTWLLHRSCSSLMLLMNCAMCASCVLLACVWPAFTCSSSCCICATRLFFAAMDCKHSTEPQNSLRVYGMQMEACICCCAACCTHASYRCWLDWC